MCEISNYEHGCCDSNCITTYSVHIVQLIMVNTHFGILVISKIVVCEYVRGAFICLKTLNGVIMYHYGCCQDI
jgi:hypothetical protein